MSEPERPLHVRVAEALGWTSVQFGWVFGEQRWCGNNGQPGGFNDTGQREIPRYDTDWSAIGPLIEKYRFCLYERGASGWVADPVTMDVSGKGPTILLAVCNLILALNKAGKL